MIPARFLPYIIGAIVLSFAVVWYGHTRYQAGYDKAEARMASRVAEAEARTARVEAAARSITERQSNEIEALRAQRDASNDYARGAIGSVRLCESARSRAVPGTPGSSPAAPSADPAEGIPVSPGPDIGQELVSLAESCQRDHDNQVAWQRWYLSRRLRKANE